MNTCFQSTYYVPGTVLGGRDTAVSKTMCLPSYLTLHQGKLAIIRHTNVSNQPGICAVKINRVGWGIGIGGAEGGQHLRTGVAQNEGTAGQRCWSSHVIGMLEEQQGARAATERWANRKQQTGGCERAGSSGKKCGSHSKWEWKPLECFKQECSTIWVMFFKESLWLLRSQ